MAKFPVPRVIHGSLSTCQSHKNKPHTSESPEEDTFPDAWFTIFSGIDTKGMGPHQLITPQRGTLMISNGLCTNSVPLLAMQHHSTVRTVWQPQVVPVCNKYRLCYGTLIMLRVISGYINRRISSYAAGSLCMEIRLLMWAEICQTRLQRKSLIAM